MSLTKNIGGTAVGLGSLALVGRSAKMIKESMKPKTSSKKIIKGYADLTVGNVLLEASAKLVGDLD